MLSSFFFKPAAFCQAGENGALFFGRLFCQNPGAADRTFTVYRFVPGGKCAIRELIATVKEFAAFGGAFDNVPVAAVLRALNSDFFAIAVGI